MDKPLNNLNSGQGRGPLTGLNVLDFGHYYAGPMVGMMLADQGAEVIRILRPEGPELPSQQYRLLNRNKKLLTLDLKTPEGKAQASALIEGADVVIENFRPGVMKRLGLDYASVKKINPSLIYLSLPGFASTDKKRAHVQAWEGVVSAACGVYTHMHLQRHALNFPPVYSWVPLLSVYAGMNGSIAVMAALLAREQYGVGTVIEVPMAEVAHIALIRELLFQPFSHSSKGLPEAYKSLEFVVGDSPAVQAQKLEKAGQTMKITSPFENVYRCKDGRDVLIGTFFMRHIVERLLKALGIHHQLLREGYVNEGMFVFGLDNNLSNAPQLSAERAQRLLQLVSKAFLTKTAEDWETILSDAGVMVSIVRTREEWLALEPMLESGVFTELNDDLSTLTVPGRVASVSQPGGETADAYREAKLITTAEAATLFKGRRIQMRSQAAAPLKKSDLLKGLKVLDLSNVLAGPVGSWVLAGYGADVIKADHPESYTYPLIIVTGLIIGQGKRSILTDIKTASGREIFQRLVSWADVVTHNVVGDTARRLGVTCDQLHAVNPDVVACRLSAFGGTRPGGWEKRIGFDGTAQAASGVITQYGSGHGAGKTADIVAGFTLAFTALLAVWQQRKTGCAGEGHTSLAQAINYSQLPYMIAEHGRSEWGEPHGQFAVGLHWWQRLYACRDGWIYVGTREDRRHVLAQTVIGESFADGSAMEAAFAAHDCAHWLAALQAAEIGCHRVMTADDIYNAAHVRAVDNSVADEMAGASCEILCWKNHPCSRPITSPAPSWVRVGEEHSYLRLAPAPRLGGNTVEILQELGYGSEAIADLIRIKAVHEYLPLLSGKDVYFPQGDSFAGYGLRK